MECNQKWGPLPSFSKYNVSDNGLVKSLSRYVKHEEGGVKLVKEKILKGEIDKYGYVRYSLYDDEGRCKHKLAHRLVLEVFGHNPHNYDQVNHINGVKADNRLANLEWCTGSHNVKHSFAMGLEKPKRGVDSPLSILTEEQVLGIFNSKLKPVEVSKAFNVKIGTVRNILTGTRWSHLTKKVYVRKRDKEKHNLDQK